MSLLKRISLKTVLAAVFCAACLMTVADFLWINYQANQDVTRLRAIVASLAQSDPEFGQLKVFRSTQPHAFIFGTLDSPQRIEIVREKVAEQFGAEKARRIVSLIRLSAPETRPG